METPIADREDPILNAWFDFVRDVLPDDAEVTVAEQPTGHDAPRPRGRYVTLKLIAGPTPVGHDELRRNPITKNFDVCGLRQWTVSIRAFRLNSRRLLETIQTKLDDTEATEKFRTGPVDIAIVDRGGITDVGGLLETGWERQYSMDVVFYSTDTEQTRIGPIERVKIQGTLKDGAISPRVVGPVEVEKP